MPSVGPLSFLEQNTRRRAASIISTLVRRVEHFNYTAQIAWRPRGAIGEQRIVRLTGIHDSMGNCNAKRRLCATLKSECPVKGTRGLVLKDDHDSICASDARRPAGPNVSHDDA